MKTLEYKLLATFFFIFSIGVYAQDFQKQLGEFKIENGGTIAIKASHIEIEIEEWNKNKVVIEATMNVDGLSEKEAEGLFSSWDIDASSINGNLSITSNSSSLGNEFFFFNNDKYVNAIVDVPRITSEALSVLEDLNFVMPEIADFDFDHDFEFNFDFDSDTINFDFEKFQTDENYMKEWQEKNKVKLKELKEELKKNQERLMKDQKKLVQEQEKRRAEYEKEKIIHKERMKIHEREIEKSAKEREMEIHRILEERNKVKVKKVLKIKVPKNAKLEMDVDYCKITKI